MSPTNTATSLFGSLLLGPRGDLNGGILLDALKQLCRRYTYTFFESVTLVVVHAWSDGSASLTIRLLMRGSALRIDNTLQCPAHNDVSVGRLPFGENRT